MNTYIGETRKVIAVAIGALALAACATTRFESTWKDPAFNFKGLRKVLVMAVVEKPENQKLLEDEFSKNLAKHGAQGVPSYSFAKEGHTITEEGWKQIVVEQKMDAVVVSRLTDVETIEKDVAPQVYVSGGYGSPYAYGGYYGYYNHSYQMVSQPGYTTREEFAVVETRVFDAATGKVIWSGDSRTTLGPGFKAGALVREFAQLVVNAIYSR